MGKIQIILGSTRPNRAGKMIADWVHKQAAEAGSFEYELVDLKEVNLPMFNEPRSPAQGNYEHEHTKEWAQKIDEADGYLVVTPEYNHAYPAVLKNAFDYAYKEWNNKPIGFVSYGGGAGGARAVQQLRLVAIELQMAPIRNSINFVNYWGLFDDDGNLNDDDSFKNQSAGVVKQLEEWAKALKQLRE